MGLLDSIQSGINQAVDTVKEKVSKTTDELNSEDINIFSNRDKNDEHPLLKKTQESKDSLISEISSKYKSLIAEISHKLTQFIIYDNYSNLPPNFILSIGAGRLYELSEIPNLENHFDDINLYKNGNRLDNSLTNWEIKLGDKNVEILTDNNIVSEEWSKKTGKIPYNGTILTSDMKNAVNDAISQLQESGQMVPDKIYLTNIAKEPSSVAQFPPGSKNSIILFMSEMQNPEFLKNAIFHESAHMADYNANNDGNYFLSETKNIAFNNDNNIIKFNDKQINKSDIENIISSYALHNPLEFVANVSSMITNGDIIQNKDGHYLLNVNEKGEYKNSRLQICIANENDIEKLNDIMELYNYLTEGKIAKAKIVE